MNAEKYWIGIDVGESSTSLCFLTTSNKIEHATAAGSGTREIAKALARVDPKCIEAVALESGAGHRLPRELAALGFPVTTVDSFRAAKFLSIRSMKTDANDARGLAEVARYALETGISVHVKNVTCEQIRVQLALRHQLIGQRVAARGALRSHLRTLGSDIKRMASPTKLRDQVEVEMERMSGGYGVGSGPSGLTAQPFHVGRKARLQKRLLRNLPPQQYWSAKCTQIVRCRRQRSTPLLAPNKPPRRRLCET